MSSVRGGVFFFLKRRDAVPFNRGVPAGGVELAFLRGSC